MSNKPRLTMSKEQMRQRNFTRWAVEQMAADGWLEVVKDENGEPLHRKGLLVYRAIPGHEPPVEYFQKFG